MFNYHIKHKLFTLWHKDGVKKMFSIKVIIVNIKLG